jgi:uncharacterized metal-binding protein YceD (DUF177 family)
MTTMLVVVKKWQMSGEGVVEDRSLVKVEVVAVAVVVVRVQRSTTIQPSRSRCHKRKRLPYQTTVSDYRTRLEADSRRSNADPEGTDRTVRW